MAVENVAVKFFSMDYGNYQTIIQIFNEDKSKATMLELCSIYATAVTRNRILHLFSKLVSIRELVCNFGVCGLCLYVS